MRQGPASAVAPASPAARAVPAASSRRLAGIPATSAGSRRVRAKALVASSTWFAKRVLASASSVCTALKRARGAPSRPMPASSASRTRQSSTRRRVGSTPAPAAPPRRLRRASYSGRLCASRSEKRTTSGCTVSCAARSASLFRTAIRWPTVPHVVPRRSVSRSSGSTIASQAGVAVASSSASAASSSASSARVPGTTCSGPIRSKGGRLPAARSGLAASSVATGDV